MKRTMFLAFVLILVSAVNCFAIGAGVGVRSMGMGGTGIATANDVTAAYFNPAGLMYGPENFEMQVFAGGATQGLNEIMEMAGSTSNFIENTFANDLNVGGSLGLGLGTSVRKVGLSAFVNGAINISHKANTFAYSSYITSMASVPLTLGSTFSTPGLPIASMSVGVNLKSLALLNASASVRQTDTATGEGTMSTSSGSGFGFDIGVQGKITPLITVGAVVRNLSASANILTKTNNITVEPDPSDPTKAKVRDSDAGDVKSTYTPPTEVGVGVGVVIPITGTLIAVDLENYSFPEDNNQNKSASYTDTHIGLEQGVLFNLVMLRAGYYTDGPTEDSYYTYGLGFNLGPASLGIAAANSVKDSINSVACAQLGAAF
jgi:hypothetical protein